MKKNIAFVLPYIPVIPSGGVIIVFKYAEKLVNDGNDVSIYFKTDMVWNNKKIRLPRFLRRMVGKLGTAISPKWYHLDKKIKKRDLFRQSDLKKHEIIVATGIETVESVVRYSVKPVKKYYLIQDFENWGVEDEYVIDSYSAGLYNIVISKWLMEIVSKYSSNTVYIPDGIDTEVFWYNEKSQRVKHSIVFHYRSAAEKGCKYALEAITRLYKKYSDLKVTIISKEERVDTIPSWCEYRHNITLEEVAEINNKSEIFICSSINEGFGLPGLEAMACGCALCTTYAVNQFNAMVSPVKDVEKLYQNVVSLFENPELKEKIVKNGLKTANDFSLEKSYIKLLKTFDI